MDKKYRKTMAAYDLRRMGWQDADIAHALCISTSEVQTLLNPPDVVVTSKTTTT